MKKESMWTRNFICTMCANLCLSLSHTSVNTLVSTYAAYLGAGAILVGTLTGIFFGVAVLTRPFTGPLVPKYDNRKLMIIAYALGVLVNAGYAATSSIGAFLAFRVINGVQYGTIGVLNLTVASNSLPKSKIGAGVGVFGLSNSVAAAVGPNIGISLNSLGTALGGDAMGFRFVFIFASSIMAIALIPAFLLLPEVKQKGGVDISAPWYKKIITRHALPSTVMIMLVMMSYTLYSAYMVPYAASKGISGISVFFTVSALVMIVIKPLSGRMTDKFGLLSIIIPAVVSLSISLFIVSRSNNLPGMLIGAVFAAIGQGSAYPALQTMGIQTETPARRGVASNTLFFGIDLGFFLGPLFGSMVYSKLSYSTMYMTAVLPCTLVLVVLIFAWPAFKRRRSELDAAEICSSVNENEIMADTNYGRHG